MTLDDIRALADKFFEWPEGSGRQTVTTFSALLFAQHVLQLREKSLGTATSATTPTLREAAQQALEALEQDNPAGRTATITALRAALEQQDGPAATFAENATTQQRVVETPPSDYRRGYWDGFNIGKREGRLEAADALAQQAEPEPVAWMCPEDPERETAFNWRPGHCENCGKKRIPLYTALVQDQDPELSAALGWPGGISDPVLDRQTLLQQVARLVERAPGIGEGV